MSNTNDKTTGEHRSLDGLVGVLDDAGYTTVVGAENVQRMIRVAADDSTDARCSGWRVFPDGTKCEGCGDCNPQQSNRCKISVIKTKGGK